MVWLAACAVLWWWLPVVPHTVMTLPIDDKLLGFGSNCEKVIIQRHVGTSGQWGNYSVFDLDVAASPSGKSIGTVAHHSEGVKKVSRSPDGRIWLVEGRIPMHEEVIAVNIDTIRSDRLPERLCEIAHTWPPVISPDGRLAVFANSVHHVEAPDGPEGALVWNLATNSQQTVIPGISEPFAFTHDGKFLAACEISRRNSIRVLSMDTLTTIKSFDGPQGKCAASLRFAPDGNYLAVEFQNIRKRQPPDSQVTMCWNVVTGEAVVEENLTFSKFAAGGQALVGFDWTDRELKAFSFPTGDRILDLKTEPNPIFADWDIAPNGLTMITFECNSGTSYLQSLASRCGLTLPFSAAGKNIARVIDATSFCQIQELEFDGSASGTCDPNGCFHWINDGQFLALLADNSRNEWHIWDIPPRKSPLWFAAGAAVLGLPISLLARRRDRRLRAG
jgi:WD40 repeat protein